MNEINKHLNTPTPEYIKKIKTIKIPIGLMHSSNYI